MLNNFELKGWIQLKKTLWFMITILAISISGYAIVQYLILGAGKSGFVMSKVNFGEVLNASWYIMLYIHASYKSHFFSI